MSRSTFKPSIRSSNYFKVNSPTLVVGKQNVCKSKSYLAKLREKQEQLTRENIILSSQNYHGEELTEKPSIYSENSFLKPDTSFEQKPSVLNAEDEEILRIIRTERPKAEMRSSPGHHTGRYPSPSKNLITTDRCEEVEKELKHQKAKYRKLETQYNELLSKNTHVEMFYNDILQNLQLELENSSVQNHVDPNLVELGTEIKYLQEKLKNLENKSHLIEIALKGNN